MDNCLFLCVGHSVWEGENGCLQILRLLVIRWELFWEMEPIHVTKTKSSVLVLSCRLQCDAVEIHDSETFRALPVALRGPLNLGVLICKVGIKGQNASCPTSGLSNARP